ncbi:MAG TPA: oligosaccharide flippase family protein [Fimbriimonas sp.]|nr:oligosaccharide flippase family protein [Fimbriimonas sp.]
MKRLKISASYINLGTAASWTVTKMVASFFATATLTHLAGPGPYSLIAVALNLSGLGKLIADSGFSVWTLTSKTVTPGAARTAMRSCGRLALAAGLIATFISVGIALKSDFVTTYGPGLVAICSIAVALPCVLITGLAAVPTAWLQRHRQYSRVEMAGALSFFLSTGLVVLPMALLAQHRFSLWAVVIQNPLQVLVAFWLVWRFAKIPKDDHEPVPIDLRYQVGVFSSNLSDYLSNCLDIVLLGLFLKGAGSIGVYQRALYLAGLPALALINLLCRASMNKIRETEGIVEKLTVLKKPLTLLLGCFVILCVPSLVGLDLPRLVLGQKFSMPPHAFMECIIGQACFYTTFLIGSFLLSIGQQERLAKSYAFHACFLLGLILWMRPTTVEQAMQLYVINGLGRIGVVILTTALCLRHKTDLKPQETDHATAEQEADIEALLLADVVSSKEHE